MKMTKRFVALLMAVAMCLGMMSMSAFAAEVPETVNENSSETENLTADLPEDAIIWYQGEDGVVYQSKEQKNWDASVAAANSDELKYNSVWLTRNTTSNFSVDMPAKLRTIYGTLRVESSSNESYAYVSIIWTVGSISGYARPSDGDLYFKFYNAVDNVCVVDYNAMVSAGTRINCWLYLDEPKDGYENYDHLQGNPKNK